MNLRNRILAGFAGLALLAVTAATVALAATLRMTVSTAIVGSYIGTADLGSQTFQLNAGNQSPIILGNGTGSNQANVLFADQRTLAASATENLDLYGSLTDPFGTTLNFATIKAIRICALSTNTNNVNFGPGIAPGSSAFIGSFASYTNYSTVRPGGCAVQVAPQTGWTVTNSTGDNLGLGNSGGSTGVTFDITILGTQ